MSYGGQSNAPWQRNVMQGHPQSGGFHQGSQMFMQNAQQNNMAAFGHGGMQGSGSGNMFPGGGGGNSVSYPQPRSGLNPVAFQQGGGGGQSHCNSIGTVTKISNDCGLVNDEVFFYRNVCKGPEPKLGDRVIFEASFSNNGQFKWNATRVQLMQQPPSLMGSNKSNYNTVPPPNEYQRGQMRRNSPNRSPIRGGRHDRDHRERERLHRSRDRDEDEHERKRRREDRSRDRGVAANNRGGVAANEARGGHAARNEKDRDRGESRKKERELPDREREDREREREKERNRELEIHRTGTKGRRARPAKRYMVQIPKSLLPIKTADVQDLRQRYSSLYIPSDFFHANVKWSDTFTPENPFSLRRPCQFHIMHECVENPNEQNPDLLEPADANYLYSAKVMLMSLPPIAEIYKKCFESEDDDADHNAVHPSRLINFLVGSKGRVGSMAIGGPWSPSIDGENPDKDPSVLIRTAIRTCKALTGIDLSNCTQWYRFVELYYHRTEYKNMEKDGPPRVETVVIYLPDVHSCMPHLEEWQALTQVYKTAADGVIARRAALVAAAAAAAAAESTNDDNDKLKDVEMADNSELAEDAEGKPTDNNASTAENNESVDASTKDEGEQEEKMDDSSVTADVSGPAADDNEEDDAEIEEQQADDITDAVDENDEPAPEPTHYSLLDLKNMKIQEIRDELLARNLSDKGVRNVVMARLAKALNTEKAEETKNKSKNKQQTATPQKTTANRKPNETASNKAKKDQDKMDVDSETAAKTTTDKKAVAETKKKNEKKGPTENNAAAKANQRKAKDTKTATGKKNAAAKAKNEKDDSKEDWADIIDFQLSDIVILDEYDSSKNAEEGNLKEMSEKEKTQLIRRYTLPSSPHIVVQPNRQAKGGKFDCAVVSLSVLLDYHPDDSKERFFEVSLFAELFNDMLMRDFGFNIYKEIYLHEETPNTNNSNTCEITEIKTESDTKKEKSETVDETKKESSTKDKDEEKEKPAAKKDTKTAKEKEDNKPVKDEVGKHVDDAQSIKSESRKRKLSTSASTANGGKDHEKSVSDKKMVVVKPQLLLSFVYFDTSHCGYIYDKHLEELFSVLGLNLSRSQIRKVMGNFAALQPIFYRKLTDKEESLVSTPVIEDVDDLAIEELKLIAAGNNQYESVFGRNNVGNQISAIEGDDSKDGLTNFNGTIVHVGKLLNQINRIEKNYSDLEKLHNDLLKQHADLQKDQNKSNTKIKDLQTENKNVYRKLTDVNQDFYSLNRKYRDQNATLSYIYTRVAPYFVREKEKDKDAKTEGSREKDKDEKEKEKEKDKSKDKDSDKEKEKPKEDKEKPKEDKEKEKPKENKEKPKENKEKEKAKEDKEKEKPKEDKEKEIKKVDNKDKEKVNNKDDNAKEVVKDDKEKEKVKNGNPKEKVKDDKEKEKVKEDKEKEQPKNDKEKEKPKDDKQKEKTKDDKVKPTIQKNITEKPKPLTPAAKKLADSKATGKVIKKSDAVTTKK